MKRLEYVLLGFLLVFGGCAQTSQLDPPRPELVQISSLPSFASFVQKDRLTFNVLFCVLPDGKVADVRILGTSGNPKWDEAAMDSMRHWRFAHVVGDCPLEGMWVRNAIVVQPEEQTIMTLGELTATGKREADSLYSLLAEGITFESLAGIPSSGNPVATNIAQYPGRVREQLRKLKVHDFTEPIRVGEVYIIYKRFENHSLQGLIQ